MTFYLKALKHKSHCLCEMIDPGHLQLFVCGVLLYQEATVTYVTIISLQLLNYAI